MTHTKPLLLPPGRARYYLNMRATSTHDTALPPFLLKTHKAVTALVLQGNASTFLLQLTLRVLTHLARDAPVAIPCPMAADPQAGVSVVRYERLLHVLRLMMWR